MTWFQQGIKTNKSMAIADNHLEKAPQEISITLGKRISLIHLCVTGTLIESL